MHGMSFHGGVAETILFSGWNINNAQGMVGSVIGVILLTALYEGLKSYREYLFARTTFLTENQEKKSRNALLFSGVHFFQTFLHVIQVVLGYFLMFIFMTYNYWLCIAIGVGTAFGYWLFSWEKSRRKKGPMRANIMCMCDFVKYLDQIFQNSKRFDPFLDHPQ